MRYPAGTIGFPTILVVYRHIDLSDLFFASRGLMSKWNSESMFVRRIELFVLLFAKNNPSVWDRQ